MAGRIEEKVPSKEIYMRSMDATAQNIGQFLLRIGSSILQRGRERRGRVAKANNGRVGLRDDHHVRRSAISTAASSAKFGRGGRLSKKPRR